MCDVDVTTSVYPYYLQSRRGLIRFYLSSLATIINPRPAKYAHTFGLQP